MTPVGTEMKCRSGIMVFKQLRYIVKDDEKWCSSKIGVEAVWLVRRLNYR